MNFEILSRFFSMGYRLQRVLNDKKGPLKNLRVWVLLDDRGDFVIHLWEDDLIYE